MDITWTRNKEWGSEGMTHRATVELPDGTELSIWVVSPRKGLWAAHVTAGDGRGTYREDTTVKGAKAQAEAFVTERVAEMQTVRAEAARPVETVESLRRTEFRQTLAAAVEVVKAARARVQFRRDTCGCRHPLHTMRCGFGGTVTVVSR